jgi:hypothetical protein
VESSCDDGNELLFHEVGISCVAERLAASQAGIISVESVAILQRVTRALLSQEVAEEQRYVPPSLEILVSDAVMRFFVTSFCSQPTGMPGAL